MAKVQMGLDNGDYTMRSMYEVNGLKVHRYVFNLIRSNMYMMMSGTEAILIDPFVCEEAENAMRAFGVKRLWIILTHEHFDHISGVNYYREHWDSTVIGHRKAKERVVDPRKNLAAYAQCLVPRETLTEDVRESLKRILDYSCQIDIGFDKEYDFEWQGITFRLIETPGHSPGSICILAGKTCVFTGDSLVEGEEIVTRFPEGNKRDYQSVTKPFLEELPKAMIVFPGHGSEGSIDKFIIK